jgi:hypothetical protein
MAITASDTITYITSHKSAQYSYPVTSSHKTTSTTTTRRQKARYGLDSQDVNGYTFTQKDAQGDDQGAPTMIARRRITDSRYNAEPNACDQWDGADGNAANIGADLRPPDSLPPGAPHSELWDTQQPPSYGSNRARCQRAVQYVDQANRMGLRTYITFYPTSANPRRNDYVRSAIRMMEAKPFNTVKRWGATNEPDGIPMPVSKATAIYRALRSRSSSRDKKFGNKVPCPKCSIVAGEFAHASPKHIDYAKSYMQMLSNRKVRPANWAFHDYADVTYQHYHPNHTGYPQVRKFVKELREAYPNRRPRILISEAGVVLNNFNGRTKVWQKPAAQREAARRFLALRDKSNQISLVAYYSWFGSPGPQGFDPAFVNPPDPFAKDPDGTPAERKFRPAYCVIADVSAGVCDQQSGE